MKNIFLVAIVLCLSACMGSREKPAELLSKETMVAVLIDVHILESEIQSLRLTTDSSQVLFNTLERELFDKHEIDPGVYKQSFEYYLEGVEEMAEIYDVVIDSLNLREKSVNTTKLDPAMRDEVMNPVKLRQEK